LIRSNRFYQRFLQVLGLALLLAGCAAPPSALMLVPATGQAAARPAAFAVHEYALIEQSIDNPTHAGFQARVPDIMSTGRSGWGVARPADALLEPNEALAPFGYRLALNPSPPFSAYALYQGSALLLRDIVRLEPVVVTGPDTFTFGFETVDGVQFVASPDGLRALPRQDGKDISADSVLGNQVVSLYGAAEAAPTGALFQQQVAGGETISLTVRDGLTHLEYAGRDVRYVYDQVVYNGAGEAARYNPGGNPRMVWFYALRDGLWYYVEAGLLE
jgi:hypothetical protein